MSHRIAFNPSLPLVAATNFLAGETNLVVGDTVDLKKLGVNDSIAFEWWRSGMINHVEKPAAVDSGADDDDGEHGDDKPKKKAKK